MKLYDPLACSSSATMQGVAAEIRVLAAAGYVCFVGTV